MTTNSRRNFLRTTLGIFGGFALSRVGAALGFAPTPSEAEGPFYPIHSQRDTDFDLTRIEGKSGIAKGNVIWIDGWVADTDGNPLEGVTVDIWQANAAGRYRHLRDGNPAPLDPNFQGWAIVQTRKEGRFRLKTIMPGPYPASRRWMRPPHIHFKVYRSGYQELTTQMYFPGHPLNDSDLLLQQKAADQQKRMIASRIDPDPETYRYRIILRPA